MGGRKPRVFSWLQQQIANDVEQAKREGLATLHKYDKEIEPLVRQIKNIVNDVQQQVIQKLITGGIRLDPPVEGIRISGDVIDNEWLDDWLGEEAGKFDFLLKPMGPIYLSLVEKIPNGEETS